VYFFLRPNSVSGRDPTKFRKTAKPRKDDGLTISQLAEQMNNPGKLSTRKKIRLEEGEKTSYMVASAGAALLAGQALGASVLIVDPPRKGLDEEVLVELCKPINPNQDDAWETPTLLPMLDEKVNWVNSVKTLIYVSCGFEALTRDCDRLFSNRGAGWKLQSATGYVLFPGSDHVETICVFQRN
jgi:tRNA/tmRNA/rRNA uracil-C5-methylase (TrmA/RlmC/RlmD family)